MNADDSTQVDTVYNYAREVISLGLLLFEFDDGVHEGDGDRIIRCWCFFLRTSVSRLE